MYRVEQISKNYGKLKVFDRFSLEFPEQRITVILGPSGCGKTTLLNVLAGLTKVTAGRVVTTTEVSYLFQEPRLLPWLTVRGNLSLVLQDKMAKALVTDRVEQYLATMGLEEYRDFYPAQLSGGLRQRVALARAFLYPARLLLMDEPFKSLDLKVRLGLLDDFLAIWRQEPRTVVAVTHDLKEAVRLGDQLVVLSEKPARVVKTITTGSVGKNLSEHQRLLIEAELRETLLHYRQAETVQ
ncbi:MAG TPA: ATP-binding cassette domain-containing protein [Bacillota bacterium]